MSAYSHPGSIFVISGTRDSLKALHGSIDLALKVCTPADQYCEVGYEDYAPDGSVCEVIVKIIEE